MVRGKNLIRDRLILPHFNSLWIVRESAKILTGARRWLDDSQLVRLLNERNVIRGADPRRARNIFEALLYLGLVQRRTVDSRKFEYTVTSEGKFLKECTGDFPSSEHERNVFLRSLRYFKVPNAAQYQEPSRFKTVYQHKRVRPFYILLKAFKSAAQHKLEGDLITASVAVYANDESMSTISTLVKYVHTKFKKPDTSRAPFRDAHTLVSWGRQVGLLRGEGIYELTEQGTEFLQILERERPIWWIDSSIEEFITLSILQEAQRKEVKSVSFTQLVVEVDKIIKELSIFRSKTGTNLSELALVSVKDDTATLDSPISVSIVSDVPFEHQGRMQDLFDEATVRLCKPVPELETLKRKVKELELELAKHKEQLSKGVSVTYIPKVDELPLLATFDRQVLERYGGQTIVASEFEKRVWYVFQLLNYDVIELGHKTKEIAPDAILINKYPSLLKTGPNEAILIECKSSKDPYKFPRHDMREIRDYTERWYERCLREYMAVPMAVVVIGGHFAHGVTKRASDLEKRLYNMRMVFVDSKLLVSLLKQFIKNPGTFDEKAKAVFFRKLVKDAQRQNAPLRMLKHTLAKTHRES